MSATDSSKPFNIGVAADGSTLSHRGLDVALRLRRKNDRITTIHVYDTVKDYLPPKYQPEQIKESFSVSLVANVPNGLWDTVLREKPDHSEPARVHLVKVANELEVDLLVVGTHGRKGAKEQATILGETTDFSIRNVSAHTVVTKERAEVPGEGARFVVAVDGSSTGLEAYDLVVALMRPGDTLDVIHVASKAATDLGEAKQSESAGKVRETYTEKIAALPEDAAAKFHLLEGGNLADEIIGFCDDRDAHFLAIGADGMRAYSESKRFLGSVSDTCIRKARCNVIVAKYFIPGST